MSINSRKIRSTLLYAAFLVITSVLLLELTFRFQLLAFYQPELMGLNNEEVLDEKKPNVLIIGDSFSAHPESYVKQLRAAYPSLNFVNASVPGTGIAQHQLYINQRIKEYDPILVLYQYYVGNDLVDLQHPVNFGELSIARNLYWMISEKLLVLQYINYRLAKFKSQPGIKTLHNPSFDVSKYNKRVKTYIKADPNYIYKSICIGSDYERVWEQWNQKFSVIKESIPQNVEFAILVVPHCAQIDARYRDEMIQLGAQFPQPIDNSEYKFLSLLNEHYPSLRIINPVKEFQKLELNEIQLYYSNDPHLNLVGQKKLGEFVSRELNEVLN